MEPTLTHARGESVTGVSPACQEVVKAVYTPLADGVADGRSGNRTVMAYRLDLNADLAPTARSVAREQLQGGAEALRGGRAEKPVEAVHEARKKVKKSRALLRLVRPGL